MTPAIASKNRVEQAWQAAKTACDELAAALDAEFPVGAPVIVDVGCGMAHGHSCGHSHEGRLLIKFDNTGKRHRKHFTYVRHAEER